MSSYSFANISLAGQTCPDGALQANKDTLEWRGTGESERRLAINKSNVIKAKWLPLAVGNQLWLELKNGNVARLSGFRSAEFDNVQTMLEEMGIALQKIQANVKGENWGNFEFSGKNLVWKASDNKVNFMLPLNSISAAVGPGRNDVELQITEDDTAEKSDEMLVEIRLHIPQDHEISAESAAKTEAEAAKERQKPEGQRKDIEEKSASEFFRQKVIDVADLKAATGDVLAELDESVGMFLTPRGRYAIEFFGTFLRMVGKTYEFKVAYKSISRMFYLPRPNPTSSEVTRFMFVISLDDPIRHGQQRYPHLVMQLDQKPFSCPIHIPEEDREKHYPGLGSEVSGDLPKVVASVFKNLTGKRVFRPGDYESYLRHKAVRCSLRSNEGLLYPLDKSLFFVHKPATFVRYSEVSQIEFQRVSTGTGTAAMHTFDIAVRCKPVAGEAGRHFTFSGIDMREKDKLQSFFQSRGVNVTVQLTEMDQRRHLADVLAEADAEEAGQTSSNQNKAEANGEESEEEDSDFEGGASSSDSGNSDEEGSDAGNANNDSDDDDDENDSTGKRQRTD